MMAYGEIGFTLSSAKKKRMRLINDCAMYDVNERTIEINISVSFEILMKAKGYVQVPCDLEKMIRELLQFGLENDVENIIKTLGIIRERLSPNRDIQKGMLLLSGIDVDRCGNGNY